MSGQRLLRPNGFRVGVGLGPTVGFVSAAAVWQRQLMQIVASMRPYRQRAADVHRPAVIVNRGSGDGKVARYRLGELAANAGSRRSTSSGLQGDG